VGIVEASESNIRRASDLLRAGELVAVPTETVYGLGADALNPEAVRRIFAAKGRPVDHPLIVHLPDAEQMLQWAASVPGEAAALARAFWPGPLTLILKRDASVPDEVTGGQDTVGLRVPGHPVALALLRIFDSGIAAPSANRFGRISPTTAQHVEEELGDSVACILDGGPCDVGIESTILDLSSDTPRLLRPGAISAEAIAQVIGRWPAGAISAGQAHASPRVSGALAAHYAPRTPLQLVASEALLTHVRRLQGRGAQVAVMAHGFDRPSDLAGLHWCSPSAEAAAYAHDLYANLRRLDAIGADVIVVEAPDETREWQAVADRLGRAQTGSGLNGPS